MTDIEIAGLICRDSELQWIRNTGDQLKSLTLLFSAKEAIYKSLYPVRRRYIDFQQVELSPVGGLDRFAGYVELSDDDRTEREPVVAHWIADDGLVFTYVIHERNSTTIVSQLN